MAKILLIGEFSNVHWTLAEGLRVLGHQVTVVSDGDGWKNYKRDININLGNTLEVAKLLHRFLLTSSFKGYDVVQFIHFLFMFPLSKNFLNTYAFKYLKKYNKKLFLGAFGDDFYFINACLRGEYRYSSVKIENIDRDSHLKYALEFTSPKSKIANEFVADSVDGIIAGLYEYHHAYRPYFGEKLTFIPFPINLTENPYIPNMLKEDGKILFFLGIQKSRTVWKGTDKLALVLNEFQLKYPNDMQVEVVYNIPYSKYRQLYDRANVIVDQLYSYSPAMNSLTAMSRGKVIMGGGEQEIYDIYDEYSNFPIYNVVDDPELIFQQLKDLVESKALIHEMGISSRKFIEDHHDYIKVAKRYIEFWGI